MDPIIMTILWIVVTELWLFVQAAVIEAEAVAAQIDAIGSQLTEHDLYLRWQWIKMTEDTHSDATNSIIYVPTEANIPILEAARFKKV